MGVKTLWTILSSSGEMIDLRELQGSSVAVDLAGWIVQNNTCKGMSGAGVSRPHLRNLFFRVATLINLNIRPVFVLDADKAPDLKKETLGLRKKAAMGPSQSSSQVEVKTTRTRLKGLMNECKALLDSLGIPSVKAHGEAEALCAKLNAAKVVDAVISDDSDAFCYGAQMLLRNFSISSSGSQIERYSISKLEESLGLDRNRLIVMAICLGCDFCPNGVPGVGKETLVQLFDHWPASWNALGALRCWIKQNFEPLKTVGLKSKVSYTCSSCTGQEDEHCEACDQWSMAVSSWSHCHCRMLEEDKNLFKLEESLKKKCAEMQDFWSNTFEKVIDEFMQPCDEGVIAKLRHFQTHCPKVDDFVKICVKKLSWTEEYALEKILPLISRWQVRNATSKIIKPLQIVKPRTLAGTPSFSLKWEWIDLKPELAPENFESCEPAIYLTEFCPELIQEFEEKKKKPKKLTRKKVPKATEEKSQKITAFFKENKQPSKPKNAQVQKLQRAEIQAENLSILTDEEENLPDNLSFLIDDILSHKLKRNLSIEQPKQVLMTSTPVNREPSCKKLITPSKVSFPSEILQTETESKNVEEEDFEDSFDRMCNVKSKHF